MKRKETPTDYPYQVINPDGNAVLQASESCRYQKEIELDLLKHGYTIRFRGRKVTKKELRE